MRELGEFIVRDPEAGWLHLYRGNLNWPNSVPDYREAARLFSRQGDVAGEVRARVNLFTLLGLGGDLESAEAELGRARQALEKGADPQDRVSLLLAEARYLMLADGDQQTALRRLQEALETLSQIERPEYPLQREVLRALMNVCYDQGLYRDANHYARQARRLAGEAGDLMEEASAAYDEVLTDMEITPPDDRSRQAVLIKARAVLDLGREAQAAALEGSDVQFLLRRNEGFAYHLLAGLEGAAQTGAHLESCLDRARQLDDPTLKRTCLLAMARHRLAEDADQAWRLVNEAYAEGLKADAPLALLFGWSDYLHVVWQTRPREEAIRAGESLLDAIESLRRAQVGTGRDRLLSAQARVYYWLAGRLLDGAPQRHEIGLAFQFLERLRAQTLRERLQRVSPPVPLPEEEAARFSELAEGQRQAYRSLLDPSLEPRERRRILEALESLERQEADLRVRLPSAGPLPTLEAPPRDLLERVESALADDEAMLSFQLGTWQGYDRRFAGGAWVLVTTRAGTQAFPLEADRAALEPAIRVFLDRREPDHPAATARLYRDLLAPALSALPAEVHRLTLIPDGLLHLLPFASLRAGEDAPPLVESFELTVAPSAAVWLHWKTQAERPRTSSASALVLADPLIRAAGAQSSARGWELAADAQLGPLANARREGERVVATIRGGSLMVSGGQASEAFLKSTDLGRYDILHFAAHAVVDDSKPGRSAVLLAPGADSEDGFLRPAEIAELEGLGGKLVVLSSCSSAAGSVLRGEGVMSLARSFFVAGADVVIGSLWPLDDREAMRFFGDFYRYLSRGVDVSRALAQTQRHWIRSGRPATTWAGIVVLGNGDSTPAPGGVQRHLLRRPSTIAVLLFLVLVTLAVLLRRRSVS